MYKDCVIKQNWGSEISLGAQDLINEITGYSYDIETSKELKYLIEEVIALSPIVVDI